ncbi:pif1 [Symbiodinium sp. CCMP2592]|nr:pif1 [Symbiodinium sp. CCMP2592]CAE7614006.1 pif1 [Symbiodinium sp. CCMP2592]
MPFQQRLKSSVTIVDLCDDQETVKLETAAPRVAVSQAEDAHGADKKMAKLEAVVSKNEVPVKREKQERATVERKPTARGKYLMYAPHEGHGVCRGKPGHPCVFGHMSSPAMAAPSGLCDLCDPTMIATLSESLPGRLTYLLKNVDTSASGRAFEYVQSALGVEMANEYRARVDRARQRQNPARVRRAARGPYRKREAPCSEDVCPGRDGAGCNFGESSSAATALTSGYCGLCDSQVLRQWSEQEPAKLTSTLRRLEQAALEKALDFLKADVGEVKAKDFEARVERARRRRDPGRPKRKARGTYKRS